MRARIWNARRSTASTATIERWRRTITRLAMRALRVTGITRWISSSRGGPLDGFDSQPAAPLDARLKNPTPRQIPCGRGELPTAAHARPPAGSRAAPGTRDARGLRRSSPASGRSATPRSAGRRSWPPSALPARAPDRSPARSERGPQRPTATGKMPAPSSDERGRHRWRNFGSNARGRGRGCALVHGTADASCRTDQARRERCCDEVLCRARRREHRRAARGP